MVSRDVVSSWPFNQGAGRSDARKACIEAVAHAISEIEWGDRLQVLVNLSDEVDTDADGNVVVIARGRVRTVDIAPVYAHIGEEIV